MYTLKVKDSFDAAHYLGNGYEGKCCATHGHTYNIEVTLAAYELNKLGLGIDFKVIKKAIRDELDKYDHKLLLPAEVKGDTVLMDDKDSTKVYFYPNPTAEVIANVLYRNLNAVLNNRVKGVSVWETADCCAHFAEQTL